jgi:diguanylate cyclase (GGDEF)-like protein/PAS domain S-box-containing protein
MNQARTLGTPRLLGIVWPFIAVVLFQALLGGVSLYVLSAVRGYVGGESLWSKGQKDAIYYLNLYADSRDETIFLKYQTAILKGGNHPDDVPSLIWLYLNFRHISYLEKAIELWTIGDAYLVRLDDVAREMHQGIVDSQASDADIKRWKAQILAINDGVTPPAKAFSDALGEGSRMILRLLLATNLATALGLIVLALLRTQKLLEQRHAFADALQLEKDRAQITLQSIGDGVITTDVEGAIAYMNPAAEALTHWKAEQATGLPLAALFNLLDENAQADGFTLIEHILSGQLSGGSEHSKLIQRLDGSTVSVTLVGAPIRNAGKVSGTVLVLHDMTQERQYIANLSWQATHDALTGLANRREFEYRLEQALHGLTRQAGRHALMFLDLDQFKLVNDTCGHAAGDELLRHICALLQSGLREGDTLARLGGDEFGILLENCAPEAAEKIAEVLRQTVQNLHFVWKGRPFVTTVSIGLVHVTQSPATLEASLRAADMACYQGKGPQPGSGLSRRRFGAVPALWRDGLGAAPAHGVGGGPLLPVLPGNRASGSWRAGRRTYRNPATPA